MTNNSKSNALILGLLLFLYTFDATVLWKTRLSIADLICIFYVLANIKLDLNFLKKFFSVFFIFMLSLLFNILLYSFYSYFNNIDAVFSNLFFGLLRPFLFVSLAVSMYCNMNSTQINTILIYNSFIIFLYISFFVVTLQYAGYFPPLYNNNPSFGEISRWTSFSQGYRPTGLTNESSFFANFVVLISSAALHYNSLLGKNNDLKIIYALSLLTLYFSTSRIGIIYILIIFLIHGFSIKKILILSALLFSAINLNDEFGARILNLFSIDGDASTSERYGNTLGYLFTITSFEWPWGTGYMNSASLVMKHLPYSFLESDLTSIVSFSMPLQFIVELGIFSLPFIFYLARAIFSGGINLAYLSLLLVGLTTGMHNFLFFYIFIAILLYIEKSHEKNNRHTQ